MANSIVVTEKSEQAGCVVYWTLSGPVDLARLRAAWEAEGLDPGRLPAFPSPEVALTRACKDEQSASRLVRQHPAGGWAIVDERRGGGALSYDVGVRIRLNDRKDGLLVTPSKDCDRTEVVRIGQRVRAAWDQHGHQVAAGDASCWLIGLVTRRLGGVLLRETGGIYFVPRTHVPELQAVKRALVAATRHQVYEIPAMRTEEAVAAVLAALLAEAGVEARGFEQALEEGKLGERGLNNRAAAAEAMKAKLASYEELLGVNLESLRGELERMRAALAAAALVAASGDGKEAA
jgi:hypothetical protein